MAGQTRTPPESAQYTLEQAMDKLHARESEAAELPITIGSTRPESPPARSWNARRLTRLLLALAAFAVLAGVLLSLWRSGSYTPGATVTTPPQGDQLRLQADYNLMNNAPDSTNKP